MIRTVLGDIEKNEFGKTMCHEHFIIDLDKVRHDGISMIETVEEVVPEIEMMMDLGVEAAIADGVEVINMSLGRSGYNAALHDSVKKAISKNIAVVVASGNDFVNLDNHTYSPASFPECITVMAHGDNCTGNKYISGLKTGKNILIKLTCKGKSCCSSKKNEGNNLFLCHFGHLFVNGNKILL